MTAKKTSYLRAFGGGTDNLWETVDTIMVDLLHQGADGNGNTDADLDVEKSNITTKKDKELDEMMENLDTLLDDLQDISTMSNDPTTPPRSINSSAEKIKPKRAPTNEQFLEKENPLDSITQGLLYQTADVPLFASSEVPTPGSQSNVEEEEYNEESEGESDGWGEDPNEVGQAEEQSDVSSNRESGEIEKLQLPTEEELPVEEKSDYQGMIDYILHFHFALPPLTYFFFHPHCIHIHITHPNPRPYPHSSHSSNLTYPHPHVPISQFHIQF